MDLGTVNGTVALALPAPAVGATCSSKITDNIFRVGINYHCEVSCRPRRRSNKPGTSLGLFVWEQALLQIGA